LTCGRSIQDGIHFITYAGIDLLTGLADCISEAADNGR
jgi:hypothetical protein